MEDRFRPDTLGKQGIFVLWTRTSVPCFPRCSTVNGGTFQASVTPCPREVAAPQGQWDKLEAPQPTRSLI